MNKKLIMSAAAVLVFVSANCLCYASDAVQTPVKPAAMEKFNHPIAPGPEAFDDQVPMHKFHPNYPSKEEMQKKKAEFEKRLKLTDEQKKQIELNKQKDIENIKPIMEEIKAKRIEARAINENKELTIGEAEQQRAEIYKQIKVLRVQADNLRKENMKNFESILTEKQKKEFAKIKEEQKKEMEKRRKNFRQGKHHPPIALPVEPKPIPVEK